MLNFSPYKVIALNLLYFINFFVSFLHFSFFKAIAISSLYFSVSPSRATTFAVDGAIHKRGIESMYKIDKMKQRG